ncbi:MAG: Holliday junction resolvase RuvX, partial [Proteobacteria bacterium]
RDRRAGQRFFRREFNPGVPAANLVWDERWSTMAAERMLIEADRSRKRRGEVIDKVAATIILQSALDRMKGIAATE